MSYMNKWRTLQEKKHLLQVVLNDLLIPLSGGDYGEPSKVIEVHEEGGMNFRVSRETIIEFMSEMQAKLAETEAQITEMES